MTFKDDYVRQVLEGFTDLDKALRPKWALMDRLAQQRIADGKNECLFCGKKTMLMAAGMGYPFLCSEHAQRVWSRSSLPVFDMSDRPEGWQP